MFRRLILTICALFTAFTLAGLLSPATAISDLPGCARFAGNEAITTYQNQIMLTYLKAVGNMGEVIYAVSEDNGSSFTTLVADSDTLADYVSAPVIKASSEGIVIAFSRDGMTLSKYKSLTGNAFTTEPAIVADYADPLPLLYSYQDGDFSAITYKADSLETINYASLSNTSVSAEGDPVYYSGPSEYWGKIHCNGDIWIKQEGGGTNNGWPVFHDLVTTSGVIQGLSPDPPMAQIFLGGYQQNTPNVTINENITAEIRQQGIAVGPVGEDPNRIMFVDVNGSGYMAYQGHIIERIDTTDVWTHYPPRAGDYLFRNRFVRRDTIWTFMGGGSITNSAALVYGNLWIRGDFAGRQIWGATGDITIVDDIGLYETPMGQPPDGNESSNFNRVDFVALVSEKNIKIKYGFRSPFDSLRCFPNMGDVYIYASLYAMGNGDGNPAEDGNISFEYQHPHPSTPATYLNGNYYNNIDLHRYKYPQTDDHPWPPEIDYPFYNPLWPESHPYLERGNLHIYGSLYQKRQGFWHLPLGQDDNPQQVWDVDNQQYGGNSEVAVQDSILGITMQCVNYPGTEGDGIGYRKILLDGDSRLDVFNFQSIFARSGIRWSLYHADSWHGTNSIPEHEPQHSKTYADGKFALNNKFWFDSHHMFPLELPPGNIRQINHTVSPTIWIVRHYSPNGDTLSMICPVYGPDTNLTLFTQPTNNSLSFTMTNGSFLAALQPWGNINFYYRINTGAEPYELYYIWEPQIPGLNVNNLNNAESNLTMLGTPDSLLAFIYIHNEGEATGTLYRASGSIENVGNQDEIMPAQTELAVYPNPFRQSLSIRVTSDKQVSADISIFNLKGQKVVTLSKNLLLTKGENKLEWNGTDAQGRAVSSGLFFLKSKVAGKVRLTKVLKLN